MATSVKLNFPKFAVIAASAAATSPRSANARSTAEKKSAQVGTRGRVRVRSFGICDPNFEGLVLGLTDDKFHYM